MGIRNLFEITSVGIMINVIVSGSPYVSHLESWIEYLQTTHKEVFEWSNCYIYNYNRTTTSLTETFSYSKEKISYR